MRFHVIMFKTLRDLFSVRRSVLYLIAIAIPVVFGSYMFVNNPFGDFSLSEMGLLMQNQMVGSFFVIMSFMWIAGLPLAFLSIATCGDFVSKEQQDGTLLVLVSKPVRRYEIILGKFLAFMVNVALLEAVAFLLSLSLVSSIMNLDTYILNQLLSILPVLFLYSLLVAFVFSSLATAFSSFSRNRIKTLIALVGITILIFFGFTVIRNWTVEYGIYEGYGLNYLDVNYHLGNAYVFLLDSSGMRLMPISQGVLGMFTGVYDLVDFAKLLDRDIGAFPPSLEKKNYVHPVGSISLWPALAVVLLLAGMITLERREIE